MMGRDFPPGGCIRHIDCQEDDGKPCEDNIRVLPTKRDKTMRRCPRRWWFVVCTCTWASVVANNNTTTNTNNKNTRKENAYVNWDIDPAYHSWYGKVTLPESLGPDATILFTHHVVFDLRPYGIPRKLSTYFAGIPQVGRLTFQNGTLEIETRLHRRIEKVVQDGKWPWSSIVKPTLPSNWIQKPYVVEYNHPHNWIQTSGETFEITHSNGWIDRVRLVNGHLEMESRPRRRRVRGCLELQISEDGGRYNDRQVTAVSPCGSGMSHMKLIEAPVGNLSHYSVIADVQLPQACFHHMIVADRDLVFVPCGGLMPHQTHFDLFWDRSQQRLYTFPAESGAVVHIFRSERRGKVFHSWHARMLDFNVNKLRVLDHRLPTYHLEHCQYEFDADKRLCTTLDTDSWLNLIALGGSYVGVAAKENEEWFNKVKKVNFHDDTMEILSVRDFEHIVALEIVNDALLVLHKERPSMRVSLCRLDTDTLQDHWCVTMPIPMNKVAHTMLCNDQQQCRSSTDIRIESTLALN